LDIFLNNIRESGYESFVTILVGTTSAIASVAADQMADIIFIDADHRYSQVRNDILNWYPKLKDGGLLCGQDFEKHLKECDYYRLLEKCEEDYVDGCHYGVIRAVSELFPDVQREESIWHVQKDPKHLLAPKGVGRAGISLVEDILPKEREIVSQEAGEKSKSL